MNRDQQELAMLSLAKQALDEVSAWEAKLESIYAEVEALDSELAGNALKAFGDRALAIALLCGPLQALGGKSVMLAALELKRDPVDILLQND